MAEYIEREETCGDCIHADICKDVVGSWFSRKNIAYCKTFKPAADVAPVVHGRWEILLIAAVDTIGKCTNCKGEAVWRTRKKPYVICPNCGAHMKDGE